MLSGSYKFPAPSCPLVRTAIFGHADREILEIENAQRQDHRGATVARIFRMLHRGCGLGADEAPSIPRGAPIPTFTSCGGELLILGFGALRRRPRSEPARVGGEFRALG